MVGPGLQVIRDRVMTRKNSRIGDWLVQEGSDPDTVEVIERERQRTRSAFSQAIRESLSTKNRARCPLAFHGHLTIDLDIVTVPAQLSTRYHTILRHRYRVFQSLSETGLLL